MVTSVGQFQNAADALTNPNVESVRISQFNSAAGRKGEQVASAVRDQPSLQFVRTFLVARRLKIEDSDRQSRIAAVQPGKLEHRSGGTAGAHPKQICRRILDQGADGRARCAVQTREHRNCAGIPGRSLRQLEDGALVVGPAAARGAEQVSRRVDQQAAVGAELRRGEAVDYRRTGSTSRHLKDHAGRGAIHRHRLGAEHIALGIDGRVASECALSGCRQQDGGGGVRAAGPRQLEHARSGVAEHIAMRIGHQVERRQDVQVGRYPAGVAVHERGA